MQREILWTERSVLRFKDVFMATLS